MTDQNRDKIIRRVQAMLKFTPGASTEGEVLAAAKMAANLIDAYGITDAELNQAQSAGFVTNSIRINEPWAEDFFNSVATAEIATYTGTAPIFARNHDGIGHLYFYGERADVQFAMWLTQSVGRFIFDGCNAEIAQLKGPNQAAIDAYRFGYLVSATQRIAKRLAEMVAERNQDRRSNNLPALLDKATQAMADLKAKVGEDNLSKADPETRAVPATAIAAGDARGAAARLSRPIDAAEPVAQIR